MSPKQPPICIKVTASPSEVDLIDAAISRGYARSRADLCRKAAIEYLRSLKVDIDPEPKKVQVVFS